MLLSATNEITVACAQDTPVLTMLRPRSGHGQWVRKQSYEMTPQVPAREYVDTYGNLCQRFIVPMGKMTIKVEQEVEVADKITVDHQAPFTPVDQLPDDTLVYMLQSRYCPSDAMEDQARAIVGNARPGYAQANRICEWIHHQLEYKYGVSDASTCAAQTLKDGAGVCRDFAHVGVALSRALHLPARFVVGYLHKLDPMDMHAWYEVFIGDRWYTFDPTQAKPRGGRIVVAYGRDATDVAFLSSYAPLEVTEMDVRVALLSTPAGQTAPRKPAGANSRRAARAAEAPLPGAAPGRREPAPAGG